MYQSTRQPNLKLDLVAAQGRSGRQGRNLGQRARKLRRGLDQRRARQRLLPSFAP